MTLVATGSSGLGVGQGNGGSLQGSSPTLQGGPVKIQGSSPNLQGSSIQLQGSGTPSYSIGQSGAFVNNAVTAANNQTAQINALLAEIAKSNQKVYAPALNTNAIFGQADANANANVNPYYTKLLNDFVTQQGVAKQQQQQQTDMNVKNLQDQLATIQKANVVTGERSTEDTATKEAQIAESADNRQVDQGTQFNTDRNALAVKQAESGLTGSGLAAGAQATAQQAHDITEGRQAQTDQETKDATELTKARTFEDLSTSNINAQTTETKGETQAQFDLNKFIQGQTADLQNKQGELEVQRQGALATERQNQTKILVSNFINSIANPAQRQAAYQTYGGFL